jgi:hypothetical protein
LLNRNSLQIISYLVGIIFACASCKNELVDAGSLPDFPASNVSYSQHVEPVFQVRCTASGCHSGNLPANGLSLTAPSYSGLMNHQPRLVVSGESNNSILIQRLDGRLQPRMPYLLEPLTQNQITGIKKWIDEGARNN